MPQTNDNNDNSTTSTAVRYEYTNDLLAAVLIVSTVGAVGGSLYLTGSVPGRLVAVFAFESLLAAGWAFGRETVAAVAEHLPNPFGGRPPRQAPPRTASEASARSRREAAQPEASSTTETSTSEPVDSKQAQERA